MPPRITGARRPIGIEEIREGSARRQLNDLLSWSDFETGLEWCRAPSCPFHVIRAHRGRVVKHYMEVHYVKDTVRGPCPFCDFWGKTIVEAREHADSGVHVESPHQTEACPQLCKRAWFTDSHSNKMWEHCRYYCPLRTWPARSAHFFDRDWNTRDHKFEPYLGVSQDLLQTQDRTSYGLPSIDQHPAYNPNQVCAPPQVAGSHDSQLSYIGTPLSSEPYAALHSQPFFHQPGSDYILPGSLDPLPPSSHFDLYRQPGPFNSFVAPESPPLAQDHFSPFDTTLVQSSSIDAPDNHPYPAIDPRPSSYLPISDYNVSGSVHSFSSSLHFDPLRQPNPFSPFVTSARPPLPLDQLSMFDADLAHHASSPAHLQTKGGSHARVGEETPASVLHSAHRRRGANRGAEQGELRRQQRSNR